MRKLLILCGMKVEVEMGNQETMELIAKVLEDFDPNAPMDEDEAMFSARFTEFERKTNKAQGDNQGRTRARGMRVVRESFHIKRAAREKSAEKKRIEKEMRVAATEEMRQQY